MHIICPQCGFSRNLPQEKIPSGRVVAKCPKCGCRFRFSASRGAGEILPPKAWSSEGHGDPDEEDIRITAAEAYEREAKRFEREQDAGREAHSHNTGQNPWAIAPGTTGWVSAFYQTVLKVMFKAPLFFQKLSPKAEILRPLAFFLIICAFQTLVEQGWSRVFYSALLPEAANDPQLAKLLEMLSSANGWLYGLLLRLGVLVLQLYCFSLLMYLAYRAMARERASYNLVFQIMAYSSAPWILCLVPGVGSLAGTLWGVGCLAVGCKTAMKLTWGQTLIGFLPILLILFPLISQILHLG